MRCAAKRKDGTACRAEAHPGKRFCCFHRPDLARRTAAGRVRGGANATRRANAAAGTLPQDTPPLRLATVEDVRAAVAEAYNLTRVGRLGVNVANALGQLAGMLLKALEKGDLEKRVEALEQRAER